MARKAPALFLLCGVIAVAGSGASARQAAPEIPAIIFESAEVEIDFTEAIEGEGVDVVIAEDFERLTALAIVNTGSAPISKRGLKVNLFENGELVAEDTASIYPLEVDPGEIGFGYLGFGVPASDFAYTPFDGSDYEIEVALGDEFETLDGYRDLPLRNVELSRSGRISGSVVNRFGFDVGEIQLGLLCVENSGLLLEATFDLLDIRRINSGNRANFETNGLDQCDGEVLISAIGKERE